MDEFYDYKDARDLVERIAEARSATGRQLSEFLSEGPIEKKCFVSPISRPRSWKLTTWTGDNTDAEEIVLRVQGVICQKALPPVEQNACARHRRRYLRQSISLTSFGGRHLSTAITNAVEIQRYFSLSFHEGAMEEWVPDSYQGCPTIDMANRYFTDRHDIGNEMPVSFEQGVDPKGILANAMGDEFVHLEENQVYYYEMFDSEDSPSYSNIDPMKFRIGDIVEAQISFAAIPLKDRRYKMLVVLRGIALLDCKPLMAAAAARMQSRYKTIRAISIKRKVGYEEDEDEEVVRKEARMQLC